MCVLSDRPVQPMPVWLVEAVRTDAHEALREYLVRTGAPDAVLQLLEDLTTLGHLLESPSSAVWMADVLVSAGNGVAAVRAPQMLLESADICGEG